MSELTNLTLGIEEEYQIIDPDSREQQDDCSCGDSSILALERSGGNR